MELKRQIEYDRQNLAGLETAINETTIRFNETLELISELTERLGELREDKKDYEIRIRLREQKLQDSVT